MSSVGESDFLEEKKQNRPCLIYILLKYTTLDDIIFSFHRNFQNIFT